MNKKIISLIIGSLTTISLLTGCAASSEQTVQSTTQNTTNTAHAAENTQNQANGSASSPNDELSKAFNDELTGFNTIEQDVKKNHFTDAQKLADQLHETFHMAIVPPLTDKKGKDYAEDIHNKYDELQDAVKSKNTTKIAELIKVNRDNLDTVANILGVSIKK
ncbi:MAG: hypothetical protein ABF633_13725 [Clostridium sp.]|uniref:hypothetical protein n=1 Tax=Clostridium sp. TaxID=1506 RepID=UPI0039EA1098